jgi:glycosyltransferase involved in cell wall biosynthesis
MSDILTELTRAVERSRISQVNVVAWRDLDDPEAGGSEIHADEIMKRWSSAGLEIKSWTSAVPGRASLVERNGYIAQRAGGRYEIFPAVVLRGLFSRRSNRPDAVVEIWNGMPFLSPLWHRGRRLILIHHVHGEMWQMTLPGLLGRMGWLMEHRLAPPFYRKSPIATLSTSSRMEIEERLRLRSVSVVPPGISPFFKPGLVRSEAPLVVAVGRLVPVKRFELLIRHFVEVRKTVPSACFVIVGEGYLRTELEQLIRECGAEDWISLPGRISDNELLDLYQRAWLVTSSSLREGWGMSLTEAAACGTPSVAVDIAGHRDAVKNGSSGLLVSEHLIGSVISDVLLDHAQLAQLRLGALAYADTLTWDVAALRLFELLSQSR